LDMAILTHYRFLINQEHPGFGKLWATVAKLVVWDERLFR
jgi:hypothetical protein